MLHYRKVGKTLSLHYSNTLPEMLVFDMQRILFPLEENSVTKYPQHLQAMLVNRKKAISSKKNTVPCMSKTSISGRVSLTLQKATVPNSPPPIHQFLIDLYWFVRNFKRYKLL